MTRILKGELHNAVGVFPSIESSYPEDGPPEHTFQVCLEMQTFRAWNYIKVSKEEALELIHAIQAAIEEGDALVETHQQHTDTTP